MCVRSDFTCKYFNLLYKYTANSQSQKGKAVLGCGGCTSCYFDSVSLKQGGQASVCNGPIGPRRSLPGRYGPGRSYLLSADCQLDCRFSCPRFIFLSHPVCLAGAWNLYTYIQNSFYHKNLKIHILQKKTKILCFSWIDKEGNDYSEQITFFKGIK